MFICVSLSMLLCDICVNVCAHACVCTCMHMCGRMQAFNSFIPVSYLALLPLIPMFLCP